MAGQSRTNRPFDGFGHMPAPTHVGDPFAFDVFISYSHGAGDDGTSYLQPWSAEFAKELEKELRTDRQYRDVRVFLDQDHRPGFGVDPIAPLTEGLREQIQASALLVVLMSPDYLASSWCTDERTWWFAKQGELGLPPKKRAAVVKIFPTRNEEWPAELTDSRGVPLVGFVFHSQIGGTIRPLGWTDLPGPFGREFRRALLGIVGHILPKLDETKVRLAELRRAEADAAKLAQRGGQTLYLHGRDDRTRSWERACRALKDSGFEVVNRDRGPDRVEQDVERLQALSDQRITDLSKSDAVLLIGTDDTRALDEDLVVVGKHECQSARSRSHRLLPCALLNTVGGSLASPGRASTARTAQVDWIDGTAEPWTPAVHAWLSVKSQMEALL